MFISLTTALSCCSSSSLPLARILGLLYDLKVTYNPNSLYNHDD